MKTMMKKPAAKKPVKKFEMGGFTGGPVNPAAAAAEKQQQQMKQQAALDRAQQQATRQSAAPAGRGRIQAMMAKGGAVQMQNMAGMTPEQMQAIRAAQQKDMQQQQMQKQAAAPKQSMPAGQMSASQIQQMQQQRQQQQMAASDPRARATAGRGRIQTMMAKGGVVKGKKPGAAVAIMIAMPAKGKGKTKMNMGGMCGSKKK